jgi:hypothetical protein
MPQSADEETVLKDQDDDSPNPEDPYSFEIIRFLLDLPKLSLR